MFNLVQSLIAQACRFESTSSSVKPPRRCAPHAESLRSGSTWRQRRGVTADALIPVLDPVGSLANVTRVTLATPTDPAPHTPEWRYIAHRQTPLIGSDRTTLITA
jgi:hypothetical protein